MTYTVNCSILLTELPLLERPAAVKAAGFDAVEFWWPFDTSVPTDAEVTAFENAIEDAGVQLTGLNFNAGDMPGGDRGLLSWPARSAEFLDNIDVVAGIGERLGCRAFNALYGNRIDGVAPEKQDAIGAVNLAAAAAAVGRIGGTVLLEPLSGAPRYPLLTAEAALRVIDRVKAESGVGNIRLLADFYHLTVNGDNVAAVIDNMPGTSATSRLLTAPAAARPEPAGFPSANGWPAAASSATTATSASSTGNPWRQRLIGYGWRLRRPGPTTHRRTSVPEERFDLVIRGRVLTADGITQREVGVRGGRIVAIEPLGSGLAGTELIGTELIGTEVVELADDETLLPGLVDTHVHVNEPGRTEWEGFASATRAAAAGGVTTIIDMPLNSVPPTTTVEGLKLKREVAQDQAFIDVGFWGGAIPGNKADLRPLHNEGVFGFKCFLLHSGVDEFPHLEADGLEEDMAELASFDSLMLVHAEDSGTIDHAPHPGGGHYGTFLASRPRDAENTAIAGVIERARRTGARAHIVHLSSSDALPMIARAKRDGVRLTVETCPHYLTLTAEEVPDGATAYKCCPPIREASNRELLWQGLQDGTIDCIVSDHSPSTLDLKDLENGDFAVAWGGISSLQLGLSLVWTEARQRGITLAEVVSWMAEKPAAVARVHNKGQLAPGFDADFAVFAPDQAFVVDAARLKHKNPITPYDGKALTGVVRRTYVRGVEVDGLTPHGRLIRRGSV